MPEARIPQNSANIPGVASAANPTQNFAEAICINAERIYDSCSDKDCLEDLQVYFTEQGQHLIDHALTVKVKEVEVLTIDIETEEVPYNRGFYTIDLTYYFDVMADVYTSLMCQPVTVHGLATCTKKCILYGSEGKVKTFSSAESRPSYQRSNMPTVNISVVEPIALGCRVACLDDCNRCDCLNGVPEGICNYFDGCFYTGRPDKVLFVTLGVFSIVSIQRSVQMLIPAYDFCIPDKTCDCNINSDDPCEMFGKIKFPIGEFFPPKLEGNDVPCGCN